MGGEAGATLDVERLRRDTPGCAYGTHLNNAGAALAPRPVLDAVRSHLQAEIELGGYEAADVRADEIEGAYRAVEGLLVAPEGSVAFVENATVAFAQALSSIPFRPGDTLLTTRNDYVSNQLMYVSLAERFGIRVMRAPDAPEGGADVEAMCELVRRHRPRLVAMTHVPTSSGLVQDVAPVAAAAREVGVPFLLDACQSVGQIPLDVGALGVTFLAATARKFLRGPRGSGFLYVSPEALDAGLSPLFPDLRGAEWIDENVGRPVAGARRFENWEFSWALVLGTGAAATYARGVGVDAIGDRIRTLADRLRTGLAALVGVRVLDRGPELCGIVTVSVEGWSPPALVRILRAEGIRTSAVDRASAVLDFDDKRIDGALRISPHAYNTDEEIRSVTAALEEAVGATAAGAPGVR